MSGETYILAIDHGTSGVKTALMTPRGRLIAFEFEKTELYFLPDGGVEQDPEEWWRAVETTVARIVARGVVPVESIEAVCCSSTFSSTVAVDAEGRPLMRSMTWMDSRGAPNVRRAMRGIINIQGYSIGRLLRFIALTGGGPGMSGKDDIAHVLYMRDERPDVYRRARWFLGSKDFLNLRLTGCCAASHDSVTLFWLTDNRRLPDVRYAPSLIRALKVDGEKFPPLRASTDVLGSITKDFARRTGLREETKVVVGAADLQSACVGSGAARDFEGHIYIGTSSWVLCHVPFKKTDMFHIIAALPSAIPGKYFCANEQESAGRCMEFLIENILYHKGEIGSGGPPDDVYARIDAAASSTAPGSGGVIFAPWLNGEKTPVENHTMRGGFLNMSLSTNADHLARAVMEGVAFNIRWALGYVEKFVGRGIPLNIIGGGARSDAWCQICADVMGRPIRRVADPLQSNARGAAFIASVALGHITFADVPNLVPISKTFEPNPEHKKIYDGLFREFLNIYRNNKKMCRRLNAK